MKDYLLILKIMLTFALWIVGSHDLTIRGTSIAPSTSLMVDVNKKIDNMAQTKPLSQVVEQFKSVHGDKYIYDLITEDNYVGTHYKVPIVCKKHGVFYQIVKVHANGHGCPACSNCKKLDTAEFIRRSKLIHGEFYDYSKVDYKSVHKKVEIVCPLHGSFLQDPSSHLNGHRCPHCEDRALLTTEEFIKRAKKVHGEKYDYSQTVYHGAHIKVDIICREHGLFKQIAYSHLSGRACPKCATIEVRNALKIPPDVVIYRMNKVHNFKYDYSKFVYVDMITKGIIICPEHGEFEQTAHGHLKGNGCPRCIEKSKGETKIDGFLRSIKVDFVREKKIRNESLFVKNKNLLVDFFLPSLNTIIEFNGKQHYAPIKHYGGEERFRQQQERDLFLRQYCKKNKVKLIEIPYWNYKEIENILTKELKIK